MESKCLSRAYHERFYIATERDPDFTYLAELEPGTEHERPEETEILNFDLWI